METASQQTSQELKPVDRLQQLLPDLFNPQPVVGEQFLRIQLTSDLIIAIPLSWVEETLLISPQWITSMPAMAPHVMGLMSSKGQVFWGVNLAQLLKLPIALEPSQTHEVVVIRTLPGTTTEDSANDVLFLGLVVPKILGSIRLPLETIVSPETEVDPNLQPYLSGQVVINGKTILVLSAEAIGNSQRPTLD
ncbi:chemotaxis protein CheW [Leptothoe kymatousa]|uniref:Chemotaxis protein CheW n=1 Tax=Leptothoe kymatousa TAU-MAC 1615 TaxID=2364775 RepID=A0ABS5Y3D6_9CYAN|nr:chemotaxis protein CheW [Leptothoe kymatousa]MBT9312028.1 chemotaxis protein CheW [Leptothoe kymatousa TAU-MAC 1615]